MLRVIAYTGGHSNPSGVHRVRRYISALERRDIELVESSSRSGSYPPDGKWLRAGWGTWNVAEHVPAVLRSYKYDVTLLQREMLSTFVTLEPFTKRPRVLDVDDAIWVHRGGISASRLAKMCDHVICGNRFLAEGFSRWNQNVSVLPTPVDTNRFVPRTGTNNGSRPVIGWQGQPSNLVYLYQIETALHRVLQKHPQAVLRIVSDKRPVFKSIPADRVDFVRFTWEREVTDIQEMTIGIMPIDDGIVSRGKCSFKMLLYMACGVPVVVSPFGMNREVLEKGEVGLGAATEDDWVNCLDFLLQRADERERLGKNGRATVLQHYSVDVLASQLAETLRAVVG
jgi:glycosyltransferase involved in cell wall biosynthesis